MARRGRQSTSLFGSIGSIGKNLKRLVTLSALLMSTTTEAAASHARYKTRIHPDLIKRAFDVNFSTIL